MRRALLLVALLAGCSTEIDVTLTFDPGTVSDADLARLTQLDIAVEGIEQAHKIATLDHARRDWRIVYQPRASSGTLRFLAGASDPTRQPDEGTFAAGTESVDIHGGAATPHGLRRAGATGLRRALQLSDFGRDHERHLQLLHLHLDSTTHYVEIMHNGVKILSQPGINVGAIVSFSIGAAQAAPPTNVYALHFDDVLVDDQPLTCAQ